MDSVRRFEQAFAEKVGAAHAIATCNGTASLHMALVAMEVEMGDVVPVTPLSMSATTLAILHAGAIPRFVDVDPQTWLMDRKSVASLHAWGSPPSIPVSIYGLHYPAKGWMIDDAAQTLRPHSGCAFTSYSFQSSKVLSCGEGGCLVTDNDDLADAARSFGSLGYQLSSAQPRIDTQVIRSPTYQRHHSIGFNYRLAPILAEHLLSEMLHWDELKETRQRCAALYRQAIKGCDWLTPQHVPEGWTHDYWCYSVALVDGLDQYGRQWLTSEELRHLGNWHLLAEAIVKHGGERPYAAWRLAYQEPALRHLAPDSTCPVAESLQPRLLQFQTNHVASAMMNSRALARAIEDLS